MANFWKNEHHRSFVRQKLADVAQFEIFWFFSFFEISCKIWIRAEKCKKWKKSKNFKLSHIGEFLSHEAPMMLIFSEIGHTLPFVAWSIFIVTMIFFVNSFPPTRLYVLVFLPGEKKSGSLSIIFDKICVNAVTMGVSILRVSSWNYPSNKGS